MHLSHFCPKVDCLTFHGLQTGMSHFGDRCSRLCVYHAPLICPLPLISSSTYYVLGSVLNTRDIKVN